MTRFEFVNKLNSRLYLLSEDERRDIIDEYMGHIDLKMREGKNEAEAIKDFGDIDELADGILQAYHIDSSKVQDRTLDMFVRQRVDYIGRAAEKFLSFSAKQIAKFFAEFLVLIMLLCLMRWPIMYCASTFSYLFAWMPDAIYNSLRTIIYLTANIINIALAFVLVYHFINKRIMDCEPEVQTETVRKISKDDEVKTKMEESKETIRTEEIEKVKKTHSIANRADKFSDYVAEKAGKIGGKAKNFGRSALHAGEKAGSFVINLTIAVIKMCLILAVGLPGAIFTVCAIVGTVLAIVLYIGTGIGFIGVCICGIGVCIMSIAFMAWMFKFLGGKTDA